MSSRGVLAANALATGNGWMSGVSMPSKSLTLQEKILESIFSEASKEGVSRVEIEAMLAEGMTLEAMLLELERRKQEKSF